MNQFLGSLDLLDLGNKSRRRKAHMIGVNNFPNVVFDISDEMEIKRDRGDWKSRVSNLPQGSLDNIRPMEVRQEKGRLTWWE